MASKQASKRDETKPEEARVIKIAQQFEQLGKGKGKDSDKAMGEAEKGKETHSDMGRDASGKEIQVKKVQSPTGEGEHAHTLEDISKYRAQAQQNSMEAIRSAEERYAKAKEEALSRQKDEDQEQGGRKETVAAKETVDQEEVCQQTTDKTPGGYGAAAKETIASVGKTVIDYTKNAAEQVNGVAMSKGGTDSAQEEVDQQQTSEKTPAPAGYGEAAKETVVSVGKTVIDYTKHAAEQARDVGKNVAGYAGEKAVAAKDTTMGVSKSAAGFAGTKVVQAKDAALETGLLAAQYTLEKAVQATEATADVGLRAAEATAEKVEATKAKPLRKEQEAEEHEPKVKKEWEEKTETQGKDAPKESSTEQKGGLLEAVGETLVEIAETGKGMVIGEEPHKKL